MESPLSPRLEKLLTFLQASPSEPFLLFAVAKEYEKTDQSEKALEYYEQLTTDHPDYVGTYYHLGKLWEQKNEIRKAFFIYKKGMEVAKKANDQHAFSELAGVKLALGDDEDFED